MILHILRHVWGCTLNSDTPLTHVCRAGHDCVSWHITGTGPGLQLTALPKGCCQGCTDGPSIALTICEQLQRHVGPHTRKLWYSAWMLTAVKLLSRHALPDDPSLHTSSLCLVSLLFSFVHDSPEFSGNQSLSLQTYKGYDLHVLALNSSYCSVQFCHPEASMLF